jgi:serine/threonine-protein kinase OSR1/STK39
VLTLVCHCHCVALDAQEEYKKGVSSWNFDVAALKAQADLADDEPLLPSISENDEKEDIMPSGISALQTAEFVASATEPALLSAFGEKPPS